MGAAALMSMGCPDLGESVRMGTFNVQFLPGSDDDRTRAKRIAGRIKAGQYDIIALNEVFDEEARETLIAELESTFPSYVAFIGDPAVGAQDSGLMLFSRFEFEPLPNGQHKHDSGYLKAVNAGSNWKDVAFIEFDEDSFPDDWAGKGAAFVRVKNPRTGRIYNIAFSHLQASYPEDEEDAEEWQVPIAIRVAQMADVRRVILESLLPGQFSREDTFVLGDLNVDGDRADPNLGLDGPDRPNLWEWVEKFNKSGEFFTDEMRDAWAFEQSPDDRGLTNLYHWGPDFSPNQGARLDYVLRNRTTMIAAANRVELCVQHLTLAHNMRDGAPFIESGFGMAGTTELSDHIGLNADINRHAPRCNPLEALVDITLDAWKRGDITFPGSMQWYRFGKPGTYAFAVEDGVQFRVYTGTDMSTPAPQYFEETIEFTPRGGKPVTGTKFVFPEPPFFVRVFHPKRTETGKYRFVAHRANCSSKEEACVLSANQSINHTLPNLPINPDDTAWFELHTEKADSGRPQSLRFAVDQFAGQSFSLELRRDDGTTSVASASPEPDPDNPGMSRSVIEFAGGDGEKLYLLVKRSNLVATGYRILWETNLTVLHGQGAGVPGAASENLYCVEETDSVGIDEIYLTVVVDGIKKVDDLYIGDYDDGVYRTMEDLIGTVRYLDKVEVILRDEDGAANGDDDFLSTTIQGLPVTKRQDLNRTNKLECCDGRYLLRYNRSRSLQK
ncbi:MAG TPA: endonuclease/exonuclease/phosphatase family protein [Thermoanaerobaculia bacterium]|nr:endonuclease/exonuclease/phosphatase family protein [Thermoanaerobaculia bacterium]